MKLGAFGENFPYTNFHNLNLDWIIKTLRELNDKFDNAIASKITVANPLQWDITKQYEAYTIVMDNENAYLSMQAVPYGIDIHNTDYWQEIFNLADIFDSIKSAVSFSDDGTSTTSSANRDVDSLVWLNDVLHVVTSAITLGDTYTSSNVEPVSVEVWVKEFISDIKDELDNISDTLDDMENDIDDLEELTTSAREFILIGDSFGGGIDGDDNTHSVTGGGWIQRFATAVSGWANVYNNQTPLGGAYGFASSRPFLDVLQDAEQYVPDKKKITDIVVLGGTNDISISAGTVKTAIETFIDYCHENYPQARVAIGCIGTNVNAMINTIGPVYEHCKTKGAEYISDLRALFCLCKYIGADGTHLKQAGYEFYQPYINQAILTGASDWVFIEESATDWLTLTSVFTSSSNPVRFTFNVSNKLWKMGMAGSVGGNYRGIANVLPTSASATSVDKITTQNTVKVFKPYDVNQYILCEGKTIANTYMDADGNIYIQRPFGLSSTCNAVSPTCINQYTY